MVKTVITASRISTTSGYSWIFFIIDKMDIIVLNYII